MAKKPGTASKAVPLEDDPCSHDLSALAELVDGFRDRNIDIVKEGKYLKAKPRPDKAGAPGGTVITVRTNSKKPNRRKGMLIVVSGEETGGLSDCDAVFMTEAAVEKFVWPYYESTRIHAKEVKDLRDAYYGEYGDDIIGITHTYPSRPDKLTLGDKGVRLAARARSKDKPGEIEIRLFTPAEYVAYRARFPVL